MISSVNLTDDPYFRAFCVAFFSYVLRKRDILKSFSDLILSKTAPSLARVCTSHSEPSREDTRMVSALRLLSFRVVSISDMYLSTAYLLG